MPEVKELVEALGRAHEEFKKTNDERIEKLAAKQSVADLEAKLDRLNTEISEKQNAITRRVEEAENILARPGAGGSNGDDPQKAEHRKAFMQYVRKGVVDGLPELERKAMTVGSDPDGGYLVPTEMEAAIDSVALKNVAMLRLATIRNIGANSYKTRVRTAGAAYGWLGESEASTETTTPTYSQLEFVPGTIYAEPQISQDLLEDAEADVEGELNTALDEAMTQGMSEAFITGNGVKKPMGLLSYTAIANASYAWGKIGYVASGKAGAWADSNPSDALIDLIHALKAGYRNGATFLLNDLTLASIRKFKNATTGDYLWQPSFQAGVPGQLLGYACETEDNMPDIAANSLSIAFGNFARAYVVVRRRGMAVLRDPYTAKPFTKFYTTLRVGGGVKHFEAVKLMKFAAS